MKVRKNLRLVLALSFAVSIALTPLTVSAEEAPSVSSEKYPAAYISTQEQADTIDSLVCLNEAHTFYTLEYTADYKLDELLTADVAGLGDLTVWIQNNLLAVKTGAQINFDAGCSAFAAKNSDGDLIYGRNYDYVQNAQNILVHTKPSNGDYESYSLSAGGWLFSEGTLDSGETDLSMLVAAPYLLMDGMNEKGFIISVLKLDNAGTAQVNANKNNIMTTVAMRLALDKAATVEEALDLIGGYNMYSAMPTANFHFFLADANGHYCILEYEPGNGGVSAKGYFDKTVYFEASEDGEHEYAKVTNFYRLYEGCDDGEHGLDRYEILTSELERANYTLNEDEAMQLLQKVYQDFGETATHETQWSVVYNPTDLTAKICAREEQTDTADIFYKTQYDFSFGAGSETGSPAGNDFGAILYTIAAIVIVIAAAVIITVKVKKKNSGE